ncbi:MAG: hypothetical protein JNM72_22780 [Deltaproteobacteria bacterium]|nr:hypothetical protein [Deltaproteobacteria bacterium]
MSNQPISRERVHELSEACSADPEGFQITATRLLKEQRRISSFIEENGKELGFVSGQVAMYMLSVSMRVFEGVGGRMKKVNSEDLAAAQRKIRGALPALAPFDADFGARANNWMDRAQPHLLDEVLWALYERPEQTELEAPLDHKQSAMIYLVLWAAIEALDSKWIPPTGWNDELN